MTDVEKLRAWLNEINSTQVDEINSRELADLKFVAHKLLDACEFYSVPTGVSATFVLDAEDEDPVFTEATWPVTVARKAIESCTKEIE